MFIVVFILILSLLVLIHEAGHFFVAKIFGIKVEEFGFGFPPKVLGKKIGETLYSLNLLPIGGFVKLYGEDEAGGGSLKVKKQKIDPKDVDRAFFSRPIWQRALVVVAGVVMNLLLAVVILSYLFAVPGLPSVSDKIIVSQVVAGSPAESAGLKNGEIIKSIDGDSITTAQDVVSFTKKHLGEKVTIVVTDPKTNSSKTLLITPRKVYPSDEGPMGIAISQSVVIRKYPWYKAPYYAVVEAVKDVPQIVGGFFTLVSDIATKLVIPSDAAGPIGIAQATGEFIKIGPDAVLGLIYTLSLSLAVINVLPIPALDGGRLFFIILEAVTRKKINPKVEAYANAIGMFLLLTLIALISIHDVIRVIHGQSIIPSQ